MIFGNYLTQLIAVWIVFFTLLSTDHNIHQKKVIVCWDGNFYRVVLLTYSRRLWFFSISQLLATSWRGWRTQDAVSWHHRIVRSSSSAFELLSTCIHRSFIEVRIGYALIDFSVVFRRLHMFPRHVAKVISHPTFSSRCLRVIRTFWYANAYQCNV